MQILDSTDVQRVLLTGASGFVGNRLAAIISSLPSKELRCVVRKPGSCGYGQEVVSESLQPGPSWDRALEGQEIVIHTAGRAHVATEATGHALAEFQKVNVEGTLNLALQSARAGVARFVFISSIGVNGNVNHVPFSEDDLPRPTEPYAQSKWDAEQGLWNIQRDTGMEVVIIRPPLVYGPNAPGNFGSLVRWVEKRTPLPFGAIHNKRSFVALDNLVDLVITCIDHPAAANQLFLTGDGEDLSTTELLRGVGEAMGKPARLIPVPAGVLMLGASLLGKKAVAERLLGSLQVDISKARDLLGWEPPLSVKEGLRRCFVSENEF